MISVKKTMAPKNHKTLCNHFFPFEVTKIIDVMMNERSTISTEIPRRKRSPYPELCPSATIKNSMK